ncbi:MAG TPA: LysR substrate-binding domain-containing protein [Gemmatimonadaceae bacterium]|jgi:DNA-binding transcriptional LysR family regulator|nr:LysR substrate-binding domain-containing protein [Gemmatimonadaceae bacterium]
MKMNLHHLRLFAAVVEQGGFTNAARTLRLSQPAISKSLNELERQLHVSLLERGARGVRLTEAGRALYGRARELFGVERVAERELRELRGLKRGTLRVAASTTIATYMLPPVLGRFHMRHPSVRIRATSSNTRSVLRLLLESRTDVALVEGPISHDAVEVIPWREDELVVIAHPDHPLALAPQSNVGVEHLMRETVLVREPGSGTREVAERALALHGVRLRRTMRLGGTEAIKQGVAAGLGVAIVSRAAAADQITLGRIVVVPVRGLQIRRALTQLKLRHRSDSTAARELRLLLDEERGSSVGDASGDTGAPRTST